jgi:type IV pilus assembly protein PilO
MADLRQSRRRLSVVLIVLFCIDLAAAAVLLSPIGAHARAAQQQLNELYTELQTKTRQTAPLHGIDEKVVLAHKEVDSFYKDRLPSSYASIVEEIGKVAAANGVQATNIRYETGESDVPDLQRVLMDVSLSGDYLKEVKFINALEREKMFFIIDGVTLSGQQGGIVRLQLRLETYLKTQTS